MQSSWVDRRKQFRGEYKKAVEFELNQRKEKHILLGDFVRNKMVSAHKNAHEI